MRKRDLTGIRFERLVVLSQGKSRRYRCGRNAIVWIVRCDCGTIKEVESGHLTSGETVSCGCFIREKTRNRSLTHGFTGTKVYKAWSAMRERCVNTKHPEYANYGGRGIAVCERWQSFDNFLADVGEPRKWESIDRIDVNGDYEPANCRWATSVEQNRNTRSNRLLTMDGVTYCVAEWSERLGIKHATIMSRLRAGWSDRDALTCPIRRKEVV
jgi:hypothetical protein